MASRMAMQFIWTGQKGNFLVSEPQKGLRDCCQKISIKGLKVFIKAYFIINECSFFLFIQILYRKVLGGR